MRQGMDKALQHQAKRGSKAEHRLDKNASDVCRRAILEL